MRSNKEDPWGCSIDFTKSWEEWKIIDVDIDTQSYNRGIKKGWYILHLNETILNENSHTNIKKILEDGESCVIIFGEPDVRPITFVTIEIV